MISNKDIGKALEAKINASFATFNEDCACFCLLLQLLHVELPLTFLVTCDIDCIVFQNQMGVTAVTIIVHLVNKTMHCH